MLSYELREQCANLHLHLHLHLWQVMLCHTHHHWKMLGVNALEDACCSLIRALGIKIRVVVWVRCRSAQWAVCHVFDLRVIKSQGQENTENFLIFRLKKSDHYRCCNMRGPGRLTGKIDRPRVPSKLSHILRTCWQAATTSAAPDGHCTSGARRKLAKMVCSRIGVNHCFSGSKSDQLSIRFMFKIMFRLYNIRMAWGIVCPSVWRSTCFESAMVRASASPTVKECIKTVN